MTTSGQGWRPLHRHFEWWARHEGDRVAVTDVAAAHPTTTYRALNRHANRLAHTLVALGVTPGQLVGISAARGVGLLTAMLAVLKAGGGYVPLDPRYPPTRLAQVVEDCALGLVVGEASCRHVVDGSAARFVDLWAPEVATRSEDDLPWEADAGAPMYVIHTSGSTGRPKGVIVPHACVPRLFSTTRRKLGIGPADVWTGLHSFAFDFSVWEIWGALAHGGRYVVVSHETARDPEELWDLVVTQGVTVLNQTPTAFRWLCPVALRTDGPPGSLRLVVFGGEQLNPPALAPWFTRYGDRKPRLVNMYGITETTVHVTLRQITAADTRRTDSPIGRPLDDLRVRLLNPDLTPVGPGRVGEMFVSGAGVTAGYLNRPELTAERFPKDPDGPPDSRMYRTGDLARLDPSGELVFEGRVDRQIQVRGHRIEPGEVEALLSQVPGVGACAVAPWRNGDEVELIAYAVLADGTSPHSVRRALAAVAPAHLLPGRIVPVDALPLTPQGKLDVAVLPVPQCPAPSRHERGAVLDVVTRTCASVLGMEAAMADDDFFALGGDSMRAVQLVQSLREAGYVTTVATVYRTPVLRELAAEVEQPADADPDSDHVGNAPVPLSATQVGVLYDCDLGGDSLYRVLAAIHLAGPFDVVALTSALAALADRHEVLRHGFDLEAGGGPVHRVHDGVTIPLTVTDTADDPRTVSDRRTEWAAAIDPEQAPLLHCHVLRHRDGSHHLALVIHHALLDGWSLSLVAADLVTLYRERLGGAPADLLPTVPGRTAGHARHEERRRADPVARAFWRDRLSRLRHGSGGPVDFQLTRVRDSMPGLPAADVARRLSVPTKCVYAAAHVWATGVIANTRTPVVGLVAATRPETPGADRAVGMFVNLLPFDVVLDAHRAWSSLVRAVFAWEREVLPHRWVPTGDLAGWMPGPLFDSVFAYTEPRALAAVDYAPLRPMSDWVFVNETAFAVYTDVQRGPLTDTVVVDTQVRGSDPGQANRMLALFTEAVREICADPEAFPEPDGFSVARAEQHHPVHPSTRH